MSMRARGLAWRGDFGEGGRGERKRGRSDGEIKKRREKQKDNDERWAGEAGGGKRAEEILRPVTSGDQRQRK
jgi:hypothetical protein